MLTIKNLGFGNAKVPETSAHVCIAIMQNSSIVRRLSPNCRCPNGYSPSKCDVTFSGKVA